MTPSGKNIVPYEGADAMPRWRRRVRFSLRTLVLASLLAGSGMLVWRNWAPWAAVFVADEKSYYYRFGFTADDSAVLLIGSVYRGERSGARGRENIFDMQIKLRDADTGRERFSLSDSEAHRFGWIRFSPAGKYFFDSRFMEKKSPFGIWDTATGELLSCAHLKPEQLRVLGVSPHDNFALIEANPPSVVLATLPSLKILGEIAQLNERQDEVPACFSDDERWLAVYSGDSGDAVKIFDTATGSLKHTFAGYYPGRFTADSRQFIGQTWNGERRRHTGHFFDLNSGSLLRSVEEDEVDGHTFDRTRLDAERFAATNGTAHISGNELRDAATGELLFTFPESDGFRGFTLASAHQSDPKFNYAGTRIVTHVDERGLFEEKVRPHSQTAVWKRRRPEHWWGIAWLYEFWIAAIFAGVFVWSILRDQHGR